MTSFKMFGKTKSKKEFRGTKVIKSPGFNNRGFEQTYIKSVYTSEPAAHVSDNLESDDAISVQSENNPQNDFVIRNGLMLRRKYVISKDCYERKTTEEIISDLNSSSEYEIKQHILVDRIPKAKSLDQLAKFLKCSDTDVCYKVLSEIQNKLFSTQQTNQSITVLLNVEDLTWSFLERHVRTDDYLVTNIGVLDLTLWSAVLSSDIQDESEISRICETISHRLDRTQKFLKGKEHSHTCTTKEVFFSIREYMSRYSNHLKNGSSLPLSFLKHRTNMKIEKRMEKATFCELYAFVFRQIQKVCCESSSDGDKFLLNKSNCLPKKLHQRCKHTYRVLILGGLVYALTETHKDGVLHAVTRAKDPVKSMCHIIRKIFTDEGFKSGSMDKQWIEIYLEIIMPLMSHGSELVRITCGENLEQFDNIISLDDSFRKHVQTIMLDYCLEINRTVIKKEDGKCPLYQFTGKFGSVRVTVNILVHAFHCLSKGDVINCMENKKQETFLLEKNNIDILTLLNRNVNIVKLLAFQIKSVPYVSIVEDIQDCCLLFSLLKRREKREWLNERKKLEFLLDIICGIQYAHSKGFIVRNITPLSVVESEGIIKLADMSYACREKQDMSPGQIPTLWLSWETIWKGQFTKMSDIYALGLVAYGIWTHGCEPYTELYGKKIDEVIKLVMFHSIQPFQWPCIPDSVHKLILQCTKKEPTERVKLSDMKKEVQTLMRKCPQDDVQRESVLPFQEMEDENKKHPKLSFNQVQRNHVPIKGIPVEFINMRADDPYINQRYSMWVPSTIPLIQPSELDSWDNLTIEEQVFDIIVTEPLTKVFALKTLPDLKAQRFPNTGGEMMSEALPITQNSDRYILKSKYPTGKTLEDAALTKCVGEQNVYEDLYEDFDIENSFLRIFLQAAQLVNTYHENGWLHRDISAETIIVASEEVFMPRLGRMCRYPVDRDPDKRYIKGEIFENRIRWFPPEVIIDGLYTTKSDVYMWAVMCWEVLTLLSFHDTNPTRSRAIAKPFYFIKKEDLCQRKLSGESLEKPARCPDWFYRILWECWNVNRADRPSMSEIIQRFAPQTITLPPLPSSNCGETTAGCVQMRPQRGRRITQQTFSIANDSNSSASSTNTRRPVFQSKYGKTAAECAQMRPRTGRRMTELKMISANGSISSGSSTNTTPHSAENQPAEEYTEQYNSFHGSEEHLHPVYSKIQHKPFSYSTETLTRGNVTADDLNESENYPLKNKNQLRFRSCNWLNQF